MNRLILLPVFVLCLRSVVSNDLRTSSDIVQNDGSISGLTCLNYDCKRIVLDRMDISDLVSLSRSNEYFSRLVADYLPFRISRKLIVLDLVDNCLATSICEKDIHLLKIYENYEKNHIENVLRVLGHTIQRLHIDAPSNIENFKHKSQLLKNFKLIQGYGSDQIIELNLNRGLNEFLNGVKPFERVEKLLLKDRVLHLDFNPSLSDTFPALTHLELIIESSISNENNASLSFPNLEHLTIRHSSLVDFDQDQVHINLIRSNPQIQRITFERANGKLLQVIADELPNLKHLEIKNYGQLEGNEDNLSFNFTHLNSFKLDSVSRWPKNIHFGEHLEEIEMSSYPWDLEMRKFFETNTHLKRFRIAGDQVFVQNEDIEHLSTTKMNVTEMTITCTDLLEVEYIGRLIENSVQLEEFEARIIKISRRDELMANIESTLRKTFEKKWILTKSGEGLIKIINLKKLN